MPDTVRIGVAQPLSGPIAALGQDLLNGVMLAVKELNAANFSVDGKRVVLEVMTVDDRSDPEVGKQVAQQLVDGGICAVIGHLNSGVSIPAAPIYAAHGIAQIAISTNPKYTELGFPTTLRMVANDNLQAAAVASFSADQLGGKRYATLDDGTPYGKDLAEGTNKRLEAAKKSVVLRQSFDDKTVAFTDLAAKLKAENVDVIISALNDFQVLALLEALKKINYTSLCACWASDTVEDHRSCKRAPASLTASTPHRPFLRPRNSLSLAPQFLGEIRCRFQASPRRTVVTTPTTACTCSHKRCKWPNQPNLKTLRQRCTRSTATPPSPAP
jgi:ABC-type branched-subunit amino acid transport system substrate-binding protein